MIQGITGGLDYAAATKAIFKKADVDGSGTIDKTELQSFVNDASNVDVDQLFTNLDADGSGSISTTETESALKKIGDGMQARMGGHRPDPAEMFGKLDADGDDAISLEELKAGSPDGKGPGGVSFEDFLKSQDSDGDGKISKTEFDAGIKEMESKRPAGPPPGGMGGPQGAAGASDKKSDITALLDALRSSEEDDEEDDAIKELFEKLAQKLQSSVNYDQQGNLGLSESASANTFSITA